MQFSGDGGVTPNKSFVYDPNGRETSATGAIYGTEITRYDADGRINEVDEPTTGSLTSPATITYDYYPNGEQKDVNVASSLLNVNSLMSYAYRVDGMRTKLHIGYGRRQGDFTWVYTDGGRLTTQSDPYTGTYMPSPQAPIAPGTVYAAATMTYDAYGRLAQHQLSETIAYTFQHDDEGNVTSFTGDKSVNGPFTMNLLLTLRGENVGYAGSPGGLQSHIANGGVYTRKAVPGDANRFQTPTIDPVNAVVTGMSYEWEQKWNDPESDPSAGIADCGLTTSIQDYDAAGRLLGHTDSNTGGNDVHCSNYASPSSTSYDIYSYDAENHHIGARGGSWSPGGHAYNLAGTSVHYDGDVPLFGTDAQNGLSVKFEEYADIDSSGQLTVWDRDHAGLLQTGHNDVTYYAFNLGSIVIQRGLASSTIFNGSANTPTCSRAGSCAFLPYTRLEGFDFLGLTIQGARAVDNTSGQWTTPDAYAGDVHDPMTQKAFMWDRNNPYEYSDPSGFLAMSSPYSGSWAWQPGDSTRGLPMIAPGRKKNGKKKPTKPHEVAKKSLTNHEAAEIMGWPQTNTKLNKNEAA